MRERIDKRVPRCGDLILPTFSALKALGGSGSNSEILEQIIQILNLPGDVIDIAHKGSSSITELSYQAAWARTYLRNYGVIENSARAVWSIKPDFVQAESLDREEIISAFIRKRNQKESIGQVEEEDPIDTADQSEESDLPDEVKPWRSKLAEILQNMDPFGFERLAQRILRECGFTQVEVTKKSGDGGIDGTGKLKINGIFSFNVAFQCKRYSGQVGAGAIRDFRGSLTTDIEKGVMITTGVFSRAAREEASNPGKQQIDLIDGEELISKIAEYGIGVKEIKTYEIDEEFFAKI
ncbi:MAG: restriction endonuclease [Bacteroidales bacterium]|nr:restriction endonuclease [Bacteroidales bacterium]